MLMLSKILLWIIHLIKLAYFFGGDRKFLFRLNSVNVSQCLLKVIKFLKQKVK